MGLHPCIQLHVLGFVMWLSWGNVLRHCLIQRHSKHVPWCEERQLCPLTQGSSWAFQCNSFTEQQCSNVSTMMYSSMSTWISIHCCSASYQPNSPTSPGRRLTHWALPFSDSPPKQSMFYRVTWMIVGKGRRWSSRQEEILPSCLQKCGNTALKAQGQLINGVRVWQSGLLTQKTY